MPTLTLVRGDTNYDIQFEIRESNGEITNITGCSIWFKIQKYGESSLILDKAGSVVNGRLGICKVSIGNELLNASGECFAELEIHWPGGKVLTAPEISVKILKDLPR